MILRLWMCVLLLALAGTAAAEIVPNDGQDDTAAVQEWIDGLKRPDAVPTPLPVGVIDVSDTLKVHKAMGVALRGAGGFSGSGNAGWDPRRGHTTIRWSGPEGKPIIHMVGIGAITVENINFEGPASAGILIENSGGSLGFSLRHLTFQRQTVGIQFGVNFPDRNSANSTIDTCVFQRNRTGIQFTNQSTCEHVIIRPEFAWCETNLDVQGGGDITLLGGGSYQCGTMVRLHKPQKNNRGLEIISHRFDGSGRRSDYFRTQWLDVVNPEQRRYYGNVVFQACSQIANQRVSDKPLVVVPAGGRVILRDCTLYTDPQIYEGMLAHLYSTDNGVAELIVENADGISGSRLVDSIRLHGPQAFFRFRDCGNLFSPSQSLTNFPAEGQPANEELEARVQALEQILSAVEGALE